VKKRLIISPVAVLAAGLFICLFYQHEI